MQVKIEKVSQDMNVEDGSTTNFLIFRLPNGGLVRSQVDDASMQAIMTCIAGGAATSSPAPSYAPPEASPVGFTPQEMGDGTRAHVFGGDDDEAPPPPMPSVAPMVARAPRAPMRTVGADERGYPIVRGQGGAISTDGGAGADEDGVAQA